MDSTELDALFAALADGDRTAFSRVFALLWDPTRRLCVRMVGESEADDVAQTALLKIFERSHEYDAKRPALPWALGIASWECRTARKRRERLRETSDQPPESDAGAFVEEQEQRELISAAVTAIGTLSAADQETLLATYWDAAPSVGGATLRKRRQRVLERLRDALRRLYGLD